jgi:hypothetical protein
MKTMAVGELKTNFSEVLNNVRQGKKTGGNDCSLYGRKKRQTEHWYFGWKGNYYF